MRRDKAEANQQMLMSGAAVQVQQEGGKKEEAWGSNHHFWFKILKASDSIQRIFFLIFLKTSLD